MPAVGAFKSPTAPFQEQECGPLY